MGSYSRTDLRFFFVSNSPVLNERALDRQACRLRSAAARFEFPPRLFPFFLKFPRIATHLHEVVSNFTSDDHAGSEKGPPCLRAGVSRTNRNYLFSSRVCLDTPPGKHAEQTGFAHTPDRILKVSDDPLHNGRKDHECERRKQARRNGRGSVYGVPGLPCWVA
jgi:hypothetical protein